MGEKFGFCKPWTALEGVAQPFYGDLGKRIRDVFGTYAAGLFNLNLTSKMVDHGLKFKSGISSNKETGKSSGTIESRMAMTDQNIQFGLKWTSNNDFTADVMLLDFCQGALAKVAGTMNPNNDDKLLILGSDYRTEVVALNLSSEFKSASPVVKGAIAVGMNNISVGYSTHFNSEDSKFETHNFRASYENEKYSCFAGADDFKAITASFAISQVLENTDGAVELKCSREGDSGFSIKDSELSIGVKYKPYPDCTLRCKVNNKAIVGFSICQGINDFTSLNFCSIVDPAHIKDGDHKLGFGLSIDV